MKTQEKGITLVALVVTIIILLILSGITIVQLTLNGLFEKSKLAKIKTEYTSAKEIIEMKLMEVQTECVFKNKDYKIEEIAQNIVKDSKITIEKCYYENTSSIKDEIEENFINLKGIVVSVDQYSKYKFLIGESLDIEGVLSEEITDGTRVEDFKNIDKFEQEIFGGKIETSKEDVDISVLTDISKFIETIQEKEKLEYIINNAEVFMDKILENLELSTILFKDENAMDLIISSDIWRNKILESDNDITGENSNIIKALDSSEPINLPTTNLELYNSETKTGNVLYSSIWANDKRHSPINAFIGSIPGKSDWNSANGLPQYIGYDFGEGNKVWIYKVYVKPGNDTAPTKMYLQSSNDNITWENIYEFIQYPPANNEATEVINSQKNDRKSRYWRLYITESRKSYVDLLKIQFYGK